jgi:hypothetical protein
MTGRRTFEERIKGRIGARDQQISFLTLRLLNPGGRYEKDKLLGVHAV